MRPRACLALLLWTAACGGYDDPPLGRICRSDADCLALRCSAASLESDPDLTPLALRCEVERPGRSAGAACERARDCANGVCLLAGACADACGDDADCADAAHCADVYARRDSTALAPLRACVRRVELPDDATVVSEVHAGVLRRGSNTLDLPPAAESGTLYVLEHLDDTSWPVPDSQSFCRPPLCARQLRTRDAEARVWFDLDTLDRMDGPAVAIASGDYVNPLGFVIPRPVSRSGYTLEVEAKLPGSLRVTTVSRVQRGQRLDLNLYYVGATELTPQGDRGVPQLRAALDEVGRVFAQADIFLGEVRQIAVTGALLERGADLPDAAASSGFAILRRQYQVLPQLPKLFELSAGAANVALDVFFVAGIDAARGGEVGGIAGGTPVAAGMHGTPGSGLAIAADMYLAAQDPKPFARTLAHELGHALGLFHTTEVDGRVFDPLPDTPSCPATQDANGDGWLDAAECAAYGGDNLMFPTSDASDVRLTPDQIEVLQRALILQ